MKLMPQSKSLTGIEPVPDGPSLSPHVAGIALQQVARSMVPASHAGPAHIFAYVVVLKM